MAVQLELRMGRKILLALVFSLACAKCLLPGSCLGGVGPSTQDVKSCQYLAKKKTQKESPKMKSNKRSQSNDGHSVPIKDKKIDIYLQCAK